MTYAYPPIIFKCEKKYIPSEQEIQRIKEMLRNRKIATYVCEL